MPRHEPSVCSFSHSALAVKVSATSGSTAPASTSAAAVTLPTAATRGPLGHFDPPSFARAGDDRRAAINARTLRALEQITMS